MTDRSRHANYNTWEVFRRETGQLWRSAREVKKGFHEEVIFRLRLEASSQLPRLPGVAEESNSKLCGSDVLLTVMGLRPELSDLPSLTVSV